MTFFSFRSLALLVVLLPSGSPYSFLRSASCQRTQPLRQLTHPLHPMRSAARSRMTTTRRLALAEGEGGLDDMLDVSVRPKFKGLGDEGADAREDAGESEDQGDYKSRAAARRRARRTNVNARLLNEIAEIEQARPMRESDVPEDVVAPILGYKEDLDGVNPFFALFGAACVWAASFGMWSLTQYLALFFGTHPLPEDTFYAIQRIALIVRTMVVAGAALGAGIFGMTGFGLFLMGGRVAVGVATGELDMSKRSDTAVDKQFQAIKDLLDK